ncbi:MAG TPA: hypothetical protein VNK04_08005 [Gemmataceae bacterium]|nr:hypothetical protein [Gemmataceae bacterium]
MSRRALLGRLGLLAGSLLLPVLVGCTGSTTTPTGRGGAPTSSSGDKPLPKTDEDKDKAEPIKPPRPDPGP